MRVKEYNQKIAGRVAELNAALAQLTERHRKKANNPKATATDGQGESVASLAFFGRARYNRWLDSRRYRFAPNGERPDFLSLPISPAVSFANHQSLITWSALVAASPR